MLHEVSGISSFLVSDESGFMTELVLLLDGGADVVDVSGTAPSNAGAKWGMKEGSFENFFGRSQFPNS
jgi:hypothetical protein